MGKFTYDPTRAAGGSQGGKWFKDENGGHHFGKTYGGNTNRLATEHAANQIYRLFGASAPETQIVEHDGVPTLMSKEIKGAPANDFGTIAKSDFHKNFMLDAWMANHDVAGLNADNVIVDSANKAHRIDNGSSFMYRAQGKEKPFDPVLPPELQTMRNVKYDAGKAGHALLHDNTVKQQAAEFANKYAVLKPEVDKILDAAPFTNDKREKIRQALHGRAANIANFAGPFAGAAVTPTGKVFQKNDPNDYYNESKPGFSPPPEHFEKKAEDSTDPLKNSKKKAAMMPLNGWNHDPDTDGEGFKHSISVDDLGQGKFEASYTHPITNESLSTTGTTPHAALAALMPKVSPAMHEEDTVVVHTHAGGSLEAGPGGVESSYKAFHPEKPSVVMSPDKETAQSAKAAPSTPKVDTSKITIKGTLVSGDKHHITVGAGAKSFNLVNSQTGKVVASAEKANITQLAEHAQQGGADMHLEQGPKGGWYHINAAGTKIYVDKDAQSQILKKGAAAPAVSDKAKKKELKVEAAAKPEGKGSFAALDKAKIEAKPAEAPKPIITSAAMAAKLASKLPVKPLDAAALAAATNKRDTGAAGESWYGKASSAAYPSSANPNKAAGSAVQGMHPHKESRERNLIAAGAIQEKLHQHLGIGKADHEKAAKEFNDLVAKHGSSQKAYNAYLEQHGVKALHKTVFSSWRGSPKGEPCMRFHAALARMGISWGTKSGNKAGSEEHQGEKEFQVKSTGVKQEHHSFTQGQELKTDPKMDEMIKHTYLATQAWLKTSKTYGGDTVDLYRGVSGQLKGVQKGSRVRLNCRPCTGYSDQSSTAESFGNSNVISTAVPKTAILSSHHINHDGGYEHEHEWWVMGGTSLHSHTGAGSSAPSHDAQRAHVKAEKARFADYHK
jgi:hypothetical protein